MKRAITWIAAAVMTGCFSEPTPVDQETDGSSSGPGSGSSGGSDETTTSSSGATTSSTTTAGSGSSGDEGSTGAPELPIPFARWDFDGDAVDAGPNGYDASIEGDLVFEDSPDGMALRFAADGFVDLSAAGSTLQRNLGAFSVTMVIRSDSWDAPRHTLLALGDPTPDPEDNAFILRVSEHMAEAYIETEIAESFPVGDPPPVGAWHRVTFVVDGTELVYFVDADEVGRVAITPSTTPSTTLQFGIWAAGNEFTGLLDSLALYDVILSAEVIAALP